MSHLSKIDFDSEDLSKRLKVLTVNEQRDFYGLPIFSDEDRELFFDLSDLPDGIYLLRLQIRKQTETAKIILLK